MTGTEAKEKWDSDADSRKAQKSSWKSIMPIQVMFAAVQKSHSEDG
jgi:hypothetical protein